jgi:flagellar biogenesis protein FliO
MKSTPKWLLIPPVVALLLVLGPLAMGGGTTDQPTTPETAAPAAAQPSTSQPSTSRPLTSRPEPAASSTDTGAKPGSLVPRTPDMWKMSSALVGVLLLGAVALLGLKKLRGAATPKGSQTLATLRQTMRLGTKQALHAVEFGDRILLIGESDKGLTLIESGSLPDAADDEATVLSRTDVVVGDDDDEGATPKNLLIPRPERPATRKRTTQPKAQAQQPSKADVAIAKLNDFRALLEKAAN